ncbi:lactonase family protein [Streptomyces avicenniae]|uniref:lactonase family protein n=1 Tax=Streptomyces avicenniae TaxID=500153 RepID=UPI00069949E4|nr:lactonase family protein [Streptomyces avicenniae]
MPDRLICVGSYTDETGGRGPGLTVLRGTGPDGRLVPSGELPLPGASWLEWHPSLPVLYAVHELAEGGVSAVAFDADGTPAVRGTLPTGGAEPCHLAVTPDGRHLLAANYGSGSVAVFALDTTGALVSRTDLVTHTGSGPDPDRQEGPHAHMVTLHGTDGLVTVTDLGTDTLWTYRLVAETGTLERVAASALPAGTGPRQLVHAAESRWYVVAELGRALIAVTESAPGTFAPVASSPASGHDADVMPAHFAVSADGRFGFLSNRGPDTVATFALGAEQPALVDEHTLDAAWPRQFTLDGDRMYVAAQQSDAVVVLTVDPGTGSLTEDYRVPVGSPACVAIQP